jgi:manganese transport system substrate-binding protein
MSMGLLLLLNACAPQPQPQPHANRPRVLATFTVLADLADQVACGQLQVESITKIGAEIHSYEITPSDLRRASGARMILENGLGLELWTRRFTAGLGNIPRVSLSDGITPLPIEGQPGSGKVNPHAWMSPKAAIHYVARIRDAFMVLDPPHASTYQRCAAAYSRQLIRLDHELASQLAALPPRRRLLVTCEGAFSYLARDYGLDEAWLWPVNGEREVTPQRMRHLIATVRERQVPAVFCESTVDSRAMQRVAAETGARLAGTFHVDSLSPAEGPAATYLELMRHNIATLRSGLLGPRERKGGVE